ncbi:protein-tyrosine phosphatase-like protein [Phlyctochytrium arcticum]|nr:protein-tyrosine phosphatase-like protein [Phlyctochytrium arcticum]
MQVGGIRAQRQGSSNKEAVMQRLPNQPSLVEYKNMRFLIFDAPSDRTLPMYLGELEKQNVTDVVRVCDPTYEKKFMEEHNIKVHDWPFPDGDPPPSQIVTDFLNLVSARFGNPQKKASSSEQELVSDGPKTCIGVHCVAGLGRAPVLVTMALIEAGMAPLDAVIYVRERRRGAINARQLKFVESYKRRSRDKACIIC